MGWWTDQAVPRIAHHALNTGPVHKMRAEVCAGLSGEVVEVGFGSGLNIDHYPLAVKSVDGIDPSGVGWAMASDRVEASPVLIRRAGLDGQVIESPDESYDSALSTFSLCTIPDVSAALHEVRRVLRPGGRFHFLEHGLSPSPGAAKWQTRLTPLQRRIAGGCRLDRPIDLIIEASGFDIVELRTENMPGPGGALVHVFLGSARAG